MVSRALILLFGGLLAAGCGATTGSELLAERFESEEAQQAREHAPDLFAAAEQAREELAALSGDEEAIADQRTVTRLLLDGAIEESERIALEEERLRIEGTLADQETQLAQLRRARFELQAQQNRQAASEVAQQQARVAFEEAITDEGRRYRNRRGERAALHRSAAGVLRRRAQLLLAAARAMGAAEEQVVEVTQLVETSDQQRDPHDAMQMADEAVRRAMGVIGRVRASNERPTVDQRQALIDEATAAGFTVEQRDTGLLVRAPAVFSNNTAHQPTATGSNRLSHLGALMAAHPQGVVQLRAYAISGNTAARQRSAEQRSEAAKAALVATGIDESRINPAAMVDVETTDLANAIELVFLAFAPQSP